MIQDEDAFAIAKLLGEVAGLKSDAQTQKRFLMRRLKALTDADGWLWWFTHCIHATGNPISLGVIHEGLDSNQFGEWIEAIQYANPISSEHVSFAAEQKRGMSKARTHEQLMSDTDWYANDTANDYCLKRGIDDFVYNLYPIKGSNICSAVGLFRNVGREKFSARNRRVAHIILSNVEWLHLAGLPEIDIEKVPSLTSTQQIVLMHLLDGKRRAEISELMHIKETTVKSHTQAVLRHYDVRDQVGLLAKFRSGNGMDIDS